MTSVAGTEPGVQYVCVGGLHCLHFFRHPELFFLNLASVSTNSYVVTPGSRTQTASFIQQRLPLDLCIFWIIAKLFPANLLIYAVRPLLILFIDRELKSYVVLLWHSYIVPSKFPCFLVVLYTCRKGWLNLLPFFLNLLASSDPSNVWIFLMPYP